MTVGLVAVVCLSSSMFAWVVGGLTLCVVTVDMTVHGRAGRGGLPVPPGPTPKKLTVDLRRRP